MSNESRFLAASSLLRSVTLAIEVEWRSFHANKFPANMELNEEVLSMNPSNPPMNRWIQCVYCV